MKGEKSRWIKPELTVLVRSKPEEAVLESCKMIDSKRGNFGAGPHVDVHSCMINFHPHQTDPKNRCAGWCRSDSST